MEFKYPVNALFMGDFIRNIQSNIKRNVRRNNKKILHEIKADIF